MVTTLLALLLLHGTLAGDEPAATLKGLGQPAPKLGDVAWVSGRALKDWRRGQVHVVDFWAPWSGLCRDALAPLAELRRAHGGARVTFVSVAVWRGSYGVPVEHFVQQRKDLLDHAVARDRIGETAKTWAAVIDLSAIPRAVIIDRRGRIAWVGHPLMGLDDALAAVLAEDDAALAAVIARWKELGERAAAPAESFAKARKYDFWPQLPGLVDTLLAVDERAWAHTARAKYEALVHQGRKEPAAAWGRALLEGPLSQREWQLDRLAWFIVADDELADEARDLELALAAAEKARALSGGKEWSILHTLARVHHERGDDTQAVAAQRLAVAQSYTGYERDLTEAMLAAYVAGKEPSDEGSLVIDDG